MNIGLRSSVIAAALAGLCACSGDLATGVHPGPSPAPSFSAGTTCIGARASGLNNFYPHWVCGAAVDLVASGTTHGSALDTVQNEWNNALHAQALGLPYFSDIASGRHRVAVGQPSGTTNFNGQVYPTSPSSVPDSINLASGTSGAFLPVLFTESTHIIGFGDWWESHVVPGVTDHCAGRTASIPYVNTSVCQHQVEYVYYAYNMRSTEPNEHKHILTGITGLPASNVQLHVGDTLTAQVTALRFERVNPAWCGDNVCSANPSKATLLWSGANSSVGLTGSNNANRLLTALAAGTATIAVNFAATDTNDVTAIFGTSFSPNSFTVTVLGWPDLAPGTISAPNVAAGSSFTVTLQEKNLSSSVEVPGGWTGRLYLSTDQSYGATDSLVGTFTEPTAIAPSTTRSVTRTATAPARLTPGNYYVLAILDADSTVHEANESNNTGSSAATIQVVAPPPLTATINYGPSSVRPKVNCEWMAAASGGVAPYTWVWKVNGAVVASNGNDLYYKNLGGSFTLSATATDAVNASYTATLAVEVTSSAPYCPL